MKTRSTAAAAAASTVSPDSASSEAGSSGTWKFTYFHYLLLTFFNNTFLASSVCRLFDDEATEAAPSVTNEASEAALDDSFSTTSGNHVILLRHIFKFIV